MRQNPQHSMKSITIIIFILLTMILNAGKISDIKGTEKLKNYNEIKNIEIKRSVDHSSFDSKSEIVYINGESEPFTGVAVRYKNKKITGLYFYENGKSQGYNYNYFENGVLSLSQICDNGLLHGESYIYYPSGKIKETRNYKLGLEDGEQLDYAENGNLKIRSFYKDGKVIEGIWYKEGMKKEKYGGNNGTFTATGDNEGILSLYKDKQLIADSVVKIENHTTIKLKENGKLTFYYPNGQVRVTADRIGDSTEGKIKGYYESGILAVETYARGNKINGEMTIYSESGGKQMYCENISGKYVRGRCEIYDGKGEIIHEGYFDNVSFDTLRKEKTGAIKNRADFVKILDKYLF